MFGKKKLGGIIGYLGLEDFWYSLTEEEQKILTPEEYPSPVIGDFSNPYSTPLGYLGIDLLWPIAAHDYVLADKMIQYGQKYYATASVLDKHFFLNNAADCYYMQRDTRSDALELCEKYCLMDIELYEKYGQQMSLEWKSKHTGGAVFNGRINSYKRLAILYEKANKYEEAIKICQSAISHGQDDDTKGGFQGRINKLSKKIK